MRVRIITLNVWNTEGDGRRHKIINQELRRLKPDFLALQEVIQTPQANTLDTMIEGLGLHVTHQQDIQFVAPPYPDRYGGTAIATRWPHQMVEVLDPRTPQASDVPWATLAGATQLPFPQFNSVAYCQDLTSKMLNQTERESATASCLAEEKISKERLQGHWGLVSAPGYAECMKERGTLKSQTYARLELCIAVDVGLQCLRDDIKCEVTR